LRGAFLFLAGAFLSCAFLLQPGAFLLLAGTFFGGGAFALGGPFPLGGAFLLPLGGPFPLGGAFLLLPCAFPGGHPLLFLPGAFLGYLTFTLELCGVFLFLPDAFLSGGAFTLLSGCLLLRCGTFALGGTCLPGAALIPNPAVPPGRVLSVRFAGGLWLCGVPRLYGAIRLRVLDVRAGNGPRCGQAGQRCGIELRILV
jgi:hypothetical protein